MKRYLKRTHLWLFVMLLTGFVIERYYIHYFYPLGVAKNYSDQAIHELSSLEVDFSQKVSSGQLNHLFWGEDLSIDTLTSVSGDTSLVTGVLLFSADYHQIAGRIVPGDLEPLVHAMKLSGESQSANWVVAEGSFYMVFPVMVSGTGREVRRKHNGPLEGFIVLHLILPSYGAPGGVFVTDHIRSDIAVMDEERISEKDRKEILERLQYTVMAGKSSARYQNSLLWELYWSYHEARDAYIGLVVPAVPWFQYLSLYGAIAFILYVGVGILGVREEEGITGRYGLYHQVIDKNYDLLNELKRNMEEIFDSTSTDFREVRDVSGEVLSRAAEGVSFSTGGYEEELDEHEGFILMEPNLENMQLIEGDQSELKRPLVAEEAFTPELMSLMDEISGVRAESYPVEELPEVEAQESDLGEFEEKFKLFKKEDPYTDLLLRLYSSDEPGEDMEIALSYLQNDLRADGIALMYFDNSIGCYAIEAMNGIGDYWGRYFYLLYNDSIVRHNHTAETMITVDENLVMNHFFRKRIPPAEVDDLMLLRLIPLEPWNIHGMVVAFYNKQGVLSSGEVQNQGGYSFEEVVRENTLSKYSDKINDLLPVFRKFYRITRGVDPTSTYQEVYNTLKSFTLKSEGKVNIVHFSLNEPLREENREELKEQISWVLKRNERLILNSPVQLIVLLTGTEVEQVTEVLDRHQIKYEIKSFVYPEMGKNLFAYL